MLFVAIPCLNTAAFNATAGAALLRSQLLYR
jgi:hypothetical protein